MHEFIQWMNTCKFIGCQRNVFGPTTQVTFWFLEVVVVMFQFMRCRTHHFNFIIYQVLFQFFT